MNRPHASVHRIQVHSESANQRLDQWLAQLEFIPSRSRAAELIKQGLVCSEDLPLKPSHRVQEGQWITIRLPEPVATELKPQDSPLDILFEDDDLVVLIKPAGLVVHPAAGHRQDTLVNVLLARVRKLSLGFGENRPGIVHRLDRDTSGIMVVAKNDLAHHHLAQQFKERTIERVYWAIVAGQLRQTQGSCRSFLHRHPRDRKRFASNPAGQGKWAVTHFKVRQLRPHSTWIECRLETGRTHQIRVHLSELGHPILGDIVYGGRFKSESPELALVASELGFTHPRTQERLHFKTDWPEPLKEYFLQKGFQL